MYRLRIPVSTILKSDRGVAVNKPLAVVGARDAASWAAGGMHAMRGSSSNPVLALLLLVLYASRLQVNDAHGGTGPPPECKEPYLICWSYELRDKLAPGFSSLVLPRPHTHELSCKRQADYDFRVGIDLALSDASVLSHGHIANYVHSNLEEIASLSSTYDQTLKYGFGSPSTTSSRPGEGYMFMNRTDCLLAYFSGKLLLPFASTSRTFDVVAQLEDEGVFDNFWFMMLHWSDVATTQWPVLQLLEFFALELRSGSSDANDPTSEPTAISSEVWSLLAVSGRAGTPSALAGKWSILAAQIFKLPRSAWTMAAGHLALSMVLPMQNRDEEDLGWHIQWHLTQSLLWLRAEPSPMSPLSRLIRSIWPVLPLLGAVLRRRGAKSALVSSGSRCAADFDPLWDIRVDWAYDAVRSLPLGRWPVLAETQSRGGKIESPGADRMAGPAVKPRERPHAKEAWASAIAIGRVDDTVGLPVQTARVHAWVDAVRVLHASVRRFEDPERRRPFLLVVDDSLPQEHANTFKADGMHLIYAEPLLVPEHLAACGSVQRRAEGLRFRLFGMTQYDHILYLDADALVVAPLDHIFDVPLGISIFATINGTRWTYGLEEGGAHKEHGPTMVNTGVMLISPSPDFEAEVKAVIDIDILDWEDQRLQYDRGWMACSSVLSATARPTVHRVCSNRGVYAGFCTQGLIDAVALARSRRLGDAVWDSSGAFLGCTSATTLGGGPSVAEGVVMPQAFKDHCTFDESYNLQVTHPHLGWHVPFLQRLAGQAGDASGFAHVLHWPGQPKPWQLAPVQRTVFEREWWRTHTKLCELAAFRSAAPCAVSCT